MRLVVFLLSAFSFALLATSHAAANSDQLVQACTEGDLAKVQRLLDRGAKVNEPDANGQLPLLSAMFSRKAEVVSLLLKCGADPNRVGYCPEQRCGSHPALVFAAYLNEPKLVRLLLDAKADIAWKDHLATRQANVLGFVEVFKMLRAAGGREWQSPENETAEKHDNADTGKPTRLGVSELLPAGAPSSKPSGEKLRLAIVADDSTQAAADVLTSDLSEQFQLVERNELDRVLNEQKLSRQFGADAAKAQQLGSVLGADAIAIVRKVELGAESLVELRFVRVSPGVILDTSYRAWPLQNVATWAGDAAARLKALSAKVREQQAIALSPADFRPATNTPAAAVLAKEAALLVSDRLVRQPGVVVLERKAIAALATERTLSKSGEFWAGGYLVDGTAGGLPGWQRARDAYAPSSANGWTPSACLYDAWSYFTSGSAGRGTGISSYKGSRATARSILGRGDRSRALFCGVSCSLSAVALRECLSRSRNGSTARLADAGVH